MSKRTMINPFRRRSRIPPFRERVIEYPIASYLDLSSYEVTEEILKSVEISGPKFWLKEFPQIQHILSIRLTSTSDALIVLSIKNKELFVDNEIIIEAVLFFNGSDDQIEMQWDRKRVKSFHILKDFSKTFSNYLENEKFVIKMEGILTIRVRDDCPVIQFSLHISLSERLFMREDKDFELKVGNDTVMVHKFILEEASADFVGLVSPHAIDGYGLQVVQGAVKAMYRLCINDVSIEDKCALLKFFDNFHMPEQKEILEQHLIGILATFNVTKLANCSIDANAIKLEEACRKYLCTCFNAHAVAEYDQLKLEFYQKFMKFNLCAKK